MAEALRYEPLSEAGTLLTLPPLADSGTGPVHDQRNRPLADLRISVTDRCNFRCTYCMPREAFDGYQFLPRAEILTFEEIERVARAFVALGVRKIRITGGEPLLRRDLPKLIERLAQLPVELTLTTNGVLLPKFAAALKDAGLARVTVSLDALSQETFEAIADVKVPVSRVLDGIAAALAAGLVPLKVNMVVKRNVNDHEITTMAEHFRGTGVILRFIEFMDVGATNGWQMAHVVPAKEILERVDARWPIEPLEPNYFGEVAERWRYRDGAGEIGVIASVTQPFCRGCTRLRLSTDGKLFTCLFADRGYDLRLLVRDGADETTLARAIAAIWKIRGDRYSELRTQATAPRKRIEMSYIGG
ncbi:GTP 3',8-cyclase MoaA [Hydrogenophilus hirschii]|jgi:cyclic pyranopterin phosphate synthase|nr:GTP 3',8-cyclase MoaA [Rhodocyclaceae bacterium]